MTWYKILLWPGAGYGLDMFTVEADSYEDALEKVGRKLRGTSYTITDTEFEESLRELMVDEGISRDEAMDWMDEQWQYVDPGIYVRAENMYIGRIDGPNGLRCSNCGFTTQDLVLFDTCPICDRKLIPRGKGIRADMSSVKPRSRSSKGSKTKPGAPAGKKAPVRKTKGVRR